jgi:membrane-associated phospholipid phosphatase
MSQRFRIDRLPVLLVGFVVLVTATPASARQSDSSQGGTQKPAGEPIAISEGSKPTRSFFPSLFHNLGDDVKHIPRKNTLYWLAAGTAGALAVHPFDDTMNKHFAGNAAGTFFKPGKYIGAFPVMLGGSAATYLVGRHGKPRVRHMGMDLIEATLLSEGITQAIKASVRRDRPLAADGTPAKSTYSFPSGHAAVTFAAATVFQQHLGRKAAIPTYLVASYVAMSRLHENVHFASDVVAGAAEGVIVGRSVTWHGRNFFASPMLVPRGSGVIVSIGSKERTHGAS